MNKEAIHIALAFDENFVKQFYALATSILVNNLHVDITIHAITTGVGNDEKASIVRYVNQHNASVLFYGVPEGFGQDFVLDGNWTAATYYRLLLPELLPDSIDKYLYIDTDTLIVGDLLPLFQTDISNSFIAAVRDRLVPTRPDLDIVQPFTYFNAGVLLVNRHMWRKHQVTRRAIEFLTDFPEKIRYADQDALNYLFNGKWTSLETRYNLMYADIPEGLTKREYSKLLNDTVVIHFTQHRPWKMLCQSPFRGLYHKYLQKSKLQTRERYVDFSLDKLPHFFKIRLVEFYFNMPIIKKIWRSIKS